jgi:hypothetical protein
VGNAENLKLMMKDLLRLDTYEGIHPQGIFREYLFNNSYSEFYSNDEKASVILGSLFSFYGNRLIIRDGINQYFNYFTKSGRFYHDYQGMEISGDGISRQGYTGRNLRITISEALAENGLTLKPEGNEPMVLRIFSVNQADYKDNDLEINFKKNINQSEDLSGRKPRDVCNSMLSSFPAPKKIGEFNLKNHWQNIDLHALKEFIGRTIWLCFSGDFYSDSQDDYISARFSKYAGLQKKDLTENLTWPGKSERPEFREDILYFNMTDAQYISSYNKRLRNYNKEGMEYLRFLEESKKEAAKCGSFNEDMPAVALLKQFSQRIRKAGINLIIINAPENPITLDLYKDSVWYEGYENFLRENADEYFDASEILKMQEFYDSHHPTVFGMRKFTEWAGAKVD